MTKNAILTEASYSNYLDIIRNNWIPILMHEFENHEQSETPLLILRHDVDLSLEASLKLAEIEYKKNIKSCYYIFSHSNFYNPFDAHSKACIKGILDYGHEIGLHFDVHFYNDHNVNLNKLEQLITLEKEVIETSYNCKIQNISFHDPTIGKLDFDLHQNSFCGLINAYGQNIIDNFSYISDSNGYWRFEHIEDFLEKNKKNNIQFLTHPGWWTKDNLSPNKKISNLINTRASSILSRYNSDMQKSGRKNIT